MVLMAKAKETNWVCSRCDVRASWLPGGEGGTPPGWGKADGQLHCLACRRAIAGEEAVAAASPDQTEAVTRIRTAGVIRFEIERDPTRSNSVIARACRTSVPAVTRVRGDMTAAN
jgi:hypothetical protein